VEVPQVGTLINEVIDESLAGEPVNS
jgi:hypothetical protein